MREHAGDDVGEVDHRGEEEDFLDALVIAADGEQPDEKGADGDGDVFGDVEELEAAGDAGEFADDVAEVHQHQQQHDDDGEAEAEFLADEVGEAFAGDGAHARAHFLDDDEGEGDGEHGPQQGVAELRAGLGVGEDAVGIVVDVGGDEPRAEHGEEEQNPGSPAFQHVGSAGRFVQFAGFRAGGPGMQRERRMISVGEGTRFVASDLGWDRAQSAGRRAQGPHHVRRSQPEASGTGREAFCRLKFSMKSRRFPVYFAGLPLFAACLILMHASAFAQGTRLWNESRFEDLERGTPNGVAVTSDGYLVPGPESKLVFATPSTYVWAVATDKEGNAYLATGTPATVERVTPEGKSTTLFTTREMSVQTVRMGPDGMVYAATLPSGKVYKLDPHAEGKTDDTATLVFDPEATQEKPKYVWDLAFDAKGRLYVATGAPAAVYRVIPGGEAGGVLQERRGAHPDAGVR